MDYFSKFFIIYAHKNVRTFSGAFFLAVQAVQTLLNTSRLSSVDMKHKTQNLLDIQNCLWILFVSFRIIFYSFDLQLRKTKNKQRKQAWQKTFNTRNLSPLWTRYEVGYVRRICKIDTQQRFDWLLKSNWQKNQKHLSTLDYKKTHTGY